MVEEKTIPQDGWGVEQCQVGQESQETNLLSKSSKPFPNIVVPNFRFAMHMWGLLVNTAKNGWSTAPQSIGWRRRMDHICDLSKLLKKKIYLHTSSTAQGGGGSFEWARCPSASPLSLVSQKAPGGFRRTGRSGLSKVRWRPGWFLPPRLPRWVFFLRPGDECRSLWDLSLDRSRLLSLSLSSQK